MDRRPPAVCFHRPVTVPPPFVSGDGRPVDALRLLWLVRLRREFRTLGAIVIVSLPVWFGVIIAVQAMTPSDSAAWNLADTTAGFGFLLGGAALAICVIVVLVVRFAGHTGRVASAFVPLVTRGREVTVDDEDAMRGLLPRLNRRPPVSMGLVLLFLVLTGAGVGAAVNVGPAYAANHGRGGPVVTIGKDAFISGVENNGRSRDYLIDTPYGTALAEDRKPAKGEQWVVLPSNDINGTAYLVGGHDYLLIAGVVVLISLCDAGCLLGVVRSIQREHRRRRAAGHVPLVHSVRRIGAGARPVVTFARGPSATLCLPALPDSDAAAYRLLRRRRRNTAAATISSVVVVGIGLTVIAGTIGGSSSPTTDDNSLHDITLPYLAHTGWSTDATADYSDAGQAIHDLTAYMLQDGGVPGSPKVGAAWLMIISPNDTGTANPSDVVANIDVSDIGSVSPAKAVAGGVALEKLVAPGTKGAPAPVDVSGLPAGWAGVVTVEPSDPSHSSVDVFGSGSGDLLDIEIDGHTGDKSLTTGAAELATAIARHGIGQFVRDTRQ